jgi:hypothetical protein
MAMPPRAIAASSGKLSASPELITEQATPTIGTTNNPNEVAIAGRLRERYVNRPHLDLAHLGVSREFGGSG